MQMLSGKLRAFLLRQRGIYAKPATRRAALGLAFFALFMFVLSADLLSEKIALEAGDVSDRDIVAPRTLSYVDAAQTKKLEEQVLASVADVYDIDVAVQIAAEQQFGRVFAALRADASPEAAQADEAARAAERRARLLAIGGAPLPDEAAQTLLSLPSASLDETERVALEYLRRALQRGVQADELDVTKKHIAIEVGETQLSDGQKSAVRALVDALLAPNMLLNAKETEKRRQSALANVEPVRETIREGQVVVRHGDVVTAQQILMMGELGLYKGQVSRFKIVGLAVYVVLMMAFVLVFLYKFEPKVYGNDLLLALLALVAFIALCLAKIASAYSYFAAPLATGALLAAILINPRVALVLSVALSLLYSVIVGYDMRAVLAVMLGSMAGVYSTAKFAHGYSLTKTGMWIAAVQCFAVWTTGLLLDVEWQRILPESALGLAAGIASAVITTGVLPYLEHAFNITTPIKLLELGQSNHPLMQRLLLEAPGTYHHSMIIGNLAEAAADVIGADPVTVRVSAYYHDIGKIKRPYFFVENQFGAENPHDKISPSLSTLIVTSHVKDGLEICRQYKLPKAISDVVAQHHGTMLVSFFYKRASEAEHGECAVEADFRYEGPKPQTKEAALIMIADSCEAAVRSISKPNANRIEAMVRKIIRERLNDGQFDECNLTLRELTQIGDVYTRILSSMFHSRIEYPEPVKEIERKQRHHGNTVQQLPARAESRSAGEAGGAESPGKNG